MIQFTETIPTLLNQETDSFEQRDPDTYLASRIGFCPRQLYLSKLGLNASGADTGKYRIANLIQNYLEDQIHNQYPGLEVGVSCLLNEGPLQFVGRCNLVDSTDDIVYLLKVRNGWYKFSPPVDRHIDQLQIYLNSLSIDNGKIVYISKNNLADVREYPGQNAEQDYVSFDECRYTTLVEKATTIREAIWNEGIATSADEIPFSGCGCYFCQSEDLAFQDPSAVETTHDQEDPTSLQTTAERPATSNTDVTAAESNPQQPQESGDSKRQANPDGPVLKSSEYHVPTDLRQQEIWVVWDGEHKRALAPWQEGSMYPCKWAASKECDPRRPYKTAQMVAELPIEQIHESWPFPDDSALPADIFPAILLPHDPSGKPVTFVDFDDVRDPQTGTVTTEAGELISALGGYTEVSRSGRGLHVYVRSGLPEQMGMFCGQLAAGGTIEIYDHGRFTGGTWKHVEGTPVDSLPYAGETISTIVNRYASDGEVTPG